MRRIASTAAAAAVVLTFIAPALGSAPAKRRQCERPEPECDRRCRDDHEPPADAVSGRRDGDDEEGGGEDGEEASESPALHADDGTISPA
jgi:hypothetical protein